MTLDKKGLHSVVEKFDKTGHITLRDIVEFLNELELPEIPEPELVERIMAAGGSMNREERCYFIHSFSVH